MRLHVLVLVFLCLWCGGIGLGYIAFLTKAFSSSSEYNPAALTPFGMLLFAYALTMGGFKFESNKSKKYLLTLLEAELIDT
ncbi:MAG: hypothetical protein K0S33_3379 [Bacteroidetes bacterium]|jgi:hypothetical protein|nr:hypothetical protein [Bacteroidota bacterium]